MAAFQLIEPLSSVQQPSKGKRKKIYARAGAGRQGGGGKNRDHIPWGGASTIALPTTKGHKGEIYTICQQ